ncbi:hypothetical protein H4R21_001405 [Coemansia helicoidea]|uniref:Uncharacterized protein n=1 Tax=Coemansia helicoidea TaxID=1286919 RepID=A0ACC1LCP0_9FUNG|nr:hypothetical protein H4R21_001405 [Coemansia helicoidea]
MGLVSGPANHSWASFSTNSDSQEIEFAKLKRLDVAYGTTYHEDGIAVHHRDGHPWKLHFPSLTRLDVRSSQDICPLLEYAVLPPGMESIAIKLKPAAFQRLASLALPAAKRISLHITWGSTHGEPGGFPAVNRVLESARGSGTLELFVFEKMLPAEAECITCTALTHLFVGSPVGADTVLAFIRRLPNLVELRLLDLDSSDVQADISVPSADADAVVEPLHMSLYGLYIWYNARSQLPDTVVAVVKYMLLGIPTLAKLSATQAPRRPVDEFVEAYAPRYPRLRSVELAFADGAGSANIM